MLNPGILCCIFLILYASSCNSKYDSRHLTCEDVEKLIALDQKYRSTPELMSPFFFVMDSIIKSDLKYKEGLDALPSLSSAQQDSVRSQAKAIIVHRAKPNKEVVDSLWSLQKEIDVSNTNRVIRFIQSIDKEKLDSVECSSKAMLIFIHTPKQKLKTVRRLIEERKDYISDSQYRHLMWHLNGRKSLGN